MRTIEGCTCANPWRYGGTTHYGTCTTGFGTSDPPPGMAPDSRWCMLAPGCTSAPVAQIGGRRIGLCAVPQGRTAVQSTEPCVFPQTYYGVPVEDCISWDSASSPPAEGLSPYCFTESGNVGRVPCAPLPACTSLDMHSCPSNLPDAGDDFSAGSAAATWASRPCMLQLCAAQLRGGDAGVCAGDAARAQTVYGTLAGSASYAAQLRVQGINGEVLCSLSLLHCL